MRPTGFGMTRREKGSRHTGHAGGRAGKARPKGPEPGKCYSLGCQSRKNTLEQSGTMLCFGGLFFDDRCCKA